MTTTRMTTSFIFVFLTAALLGLAACSKAEAPTAAVVEEAEMLDGAVGVLNYTDVPIGVVYVNGEWAGGMVANAGGTSWIGSASVPKHWDPTYKVRIAWSDDELYAKDKKALYTREVPVEKYPPEGASFFYVAFFPNHEVKLYLTKWGPGWEGDPYKLEDPKVACLKRRAEKDRQLCYRPDLRDPPSSPAQAK